MRFEWVLIGLSMGGMLACLFEIMDSGDRHVSVALFVSMCMCTLGIMAGVCIVAYKTGISA